MEQLDRPLDELLRSISSLAQPIVLDEAFTHLDDAVRILTEHSGMSTDLKTAALLLRYAAGLDQNSWDMQTLKELAERGIGPGEAQTAARAFTSLALAVVACCRATPPAPTTTP